MSEFALLEQVKAANPVPDADTLPEGTIDVRTLRNYVANTPAVELDDAEDIDAWRAAPAGVGARRGLGLAAAVFIVVLSLGIGFWLARSGGEPDVVEPPQVTTTVSPPTTSPPTTAAAEEGAAVDPATLDVIESFVGFVDDRDASGAASLLSAGIATDLVDRIATAEAFEDGYQLEDCLAFSDAIRCEVLVSDFFTQQLDLEPWPQVWELQLESGSIFQLEISGDSPEVTQAQADFASFVAARDPEAPVLVDASGWVRTEATIEAAGEHLVEFAALRSGIPPQTWATLEAYFTTLSAGDLDAFEALLAPEASFEERSGPNGDATVRYTRDQDQFIGHFWFEYIGLRTDTRPIKCTGNATSVSCRARNTGVLQLDTGGFEDGLLLFDLDNGLLTSIRDRFNMPQLQNFCIGWIFENYPGDLTDIWTCAGTDIPETPEIARLLLEWYPRYLADDGTDVPPEYLDGSLLDE